MKTFVSSTDEYGYYVFEHDETTVVITDPRADRTLDLPLSVLEEFIEHRLQQVREQV